MLKDRNKRLILILIALVILVAVIVLPTVFQGLSNGEGSGGLDDNTQKPATPTTTITATSTPGSGTQTPLESQDQVRFTVYVDESSIKECGWTCREIPASLTNSGEETAHNVNVNVRFYCNGDRIDINGKEYLSLDLGTMEPGETEERTEEVDVGFGGGLCIQNNGARIVFNVISDEKTMTLEETYNP